MTKCIECAYIVSRNKAMTKAMYTGCQHRPEWEFKAALAIRECEMFHRAPEADIEKRMAWFERLA